MFNLPPGAGISLSDGVVFVMVDLLLGTPESRLISSQQKQFFWPTCKICRYVIGWQYRVEILHVTPGAFNNNS